MIDNQVTNAVIILGRLLVMGVIFPILIVILLVSYNVTWLINKIMDLLSIKS
jgi:hypothetical protein